MNLRSIPFFLILILGTIKTATLMRAFDAFNFFSWIAFSMMWGWIAWGFWKNKDMPAYSGNFHYLNGENKVPRTAYVLAILFTYFLGVYVA